MNLGLAFCNQTNATVLLTDYVPDLETDDLVENYTVVLFVSDDHIDALNDTKKWFFSVNSTDGDKLFDIFD
jgi:hypothetical protein